MIYILQSSVTIDYTMFMLELTKLIAFLNKIEPNSIILIVIINNNALFYSL